MGSGKGIVNGVGDNKFEPDSDVSRQDIAVIFIRYMQVMGIYLPDVNESITFDDDNTISSYAKEAVVALQEAGIVNGKKTSFILWEIPHAQKSRQCYTVFARQ